MLGETPLPAKKRSVFDYLSEKDRERLQNIRHKVSEGSTSDTPQSVTETPPSQPQYLPGQVHIPHIHPSVAKAALSGFQPFIADPLKHSRYIAFLNYASQATEGSNTSSALGIGPMPNQSTEEFNKELSDYAKSATVFKPLSGAMAGRFTSSKVVELGPKVIEGLHTPDLSNMDAGEEEEKEEKKEDTDPRRGAVRLGMYGPLTREVTPWQPAKLLCKRFGVKEPELADPTDLDPSGPAQASSSKSEATLAPIKAITDGLENKPEGLGESSTSGRRNLVNVGLGEDETQGRDTLTYTRPPMDVFKAIFASDDEDSDDEDKENVTVKDEIPYFSTSMPADVDEASQLLGSEPTIAPSPAPAKELTQVSLPEKVDLSTFKPTFVPRADRESRKDKSSTTREKKEKKKSKPALVSFDDEEGGLKLSISAPKRKKHKEDKDGERKKKKRKEKDKHTEDDDAMWEEAAPPEVVQKLETQSSATVIPGVDSEKPTSGERPAGPSRGRARAVDFM